MIKDGHRISEASLAKKQLKFMKKFIYIINALELLEQLAMGKRLEGVLYVDNNTGA